MVVVPAVGVGILAVFGAGYALAYTLLTWRGRKPGNASASSPRLSQARVNRDTEKAAESLAILGGLGAVALLILTLVALPRQWIPFLWIGLTVLGYVAAFLINVAVDADRRRWQATTPFQGPASEKSGRSGQAPPPPAANTPPIREPYRVLMARFQYDQARVDQAIQQERKRTPFADSDELCRRILQRMDGTQDNSA